MEVETDLNPQALLQDCQRIERRLGRQREMKWGPRTIDIDILYWTDWIVNSTALQIPHPEACSRAFVMIPLCEIAPDFLLPDKLIAVRTAAERFLAHNFNIVGTGESVLQAI